MNRFRHIQDVEDEEKLKSKLGWSHFGSWVGGVANVVTGYTGKKSDLRESRILPWA